jgi:Terminase RNaseH-like domain
VVTDSSSTIFFLGLDLGQVSDYSALVVLQAVDRAPPRRYEGSYLYRWTLGTAYPDIARETARIASRVAQQPQAQEVWLAVDATGVGVPVVDMLQRERMPRVKLTPIMITGGLTENKNGRVWHVPKRNLVGVTQTALQTGRLKVASALPEAATLTEELQNFQMKISLDTGHDSYGAWREGTHDDLVLALACALWCGERKWPRFAPVGD